MSHPAGNSNLFNDDDDDDESDDVDYVPSEHDSLASDGEESSNNESASESEDGESKICRKRKGSPTAGVSDKKMNKEEEEEEKDRSEEIWAQFKTAVKQRQEMKQLSPEKEAKLPAECKQPSPSENIIPPKPSANNSPDKSLSSSTTSSLKLPEISKAIDSPSINSTQIAKISLGMPTKHPAKIGAPTSSSPSSSRLNNILSQIGSQKKSTNMLEQSRQKWDEFKQAEGISEELAIHNRGTKGYLDRQDFLARVGSRQDDQLRQMRLQLMNKRRTT